MIIGLEIHDKDHIYLVISRGSDDSVSLSAELLFIDFLSLLGRVIIAGVWL